MIYSAARGFLFLHPPKTGGTSVSLAYEARARADDLLVGDTPKAIRRRGRQRGLSTSGRLWKHSQLADLDGLVDADAPLCRMVLVRNPWDRMVSLYHWLRVQRFAHPAAPLARELTFSQFLNHPLVMRMLVTQPYARFATGADGRERPAHYVRIERFAEDFRPVAAHLGFDLVLGRENRSERCADYRGYYDAADAALVARLCAADVARSHYRFDNAG